MSITSGQVSRFLRDKAEDNILLDEVQFEEEDIRDATKFAIDEFNAMTPVTSYTEESFPNDYILLLGVTAHLMSSEAFLQLRNQATYRDGDVENIGIDDKFQLYKGLGDAIKKEWKTVAQKYKQQMNMEGGYGSLSSGYRYVYPGVRYKP